MTSSSPTQGKVYLVGAGPGDPVLLTLRAVECLRRAQLVIYDQLVDPRVLEHAPTAEHVCVGDLHEAHAGRYEMIVERMVASARAGRIVVRLKGGDPGAFGRLGEEAEALANSGIDLEIVPGVTAALAAAACAGISLTHRQHASAIAFVTGHECAGKPGTAIDWRALAAFPGTLCIYMGLKRLRAIAAALIEHGKPADTPVAVIHRATMPAQITVQATLATISDEVERRALKPPAIVLIGPVVGLRPALPWFERRPLFGKSVLLTRPAGQVDEMRRRLEELGAAVHAFAPIAIGPAPDPAAVENVLNRLHEFDWLVFTSANGVRAFMTALRTPKRDLRQLGRLNLAAIGPRTADALRAYHLEPDVVPAEYRSEALVESLLPRVREQRVLLARADRGRELLHTELSRECVVEEIAVYSQIDARSADPHILELLREGRINFITLTSANIARAFVRLLDAECRMQLKRAQIVTISPVTSAAVRELGLEVAAEGRVYTTEGMIEALMKLAKPEA